MANAVGSATSSSVIAQAPPPEKTQAPKPASNSPAAPEDKVTISEAGRAAQQSGGKK